MRPWVLVAGDFVRTGGMDAANHALASWLARSGRETHVVAHRVAPELVEAGVVWHPVQRPLGSHTLGFPRLDAAGRRVAASLAGRRPIVLDNGGNTAAGTATWLHYVHAAYDPPSAAGPLRRLLAARNRRDALGRERAAVARASVVLANSDLTKRHATTLLDASPDRVETVYYGTDPARFRPPTPEERRAARILLGVAPEARAVAFVGALGDRRKGFDTLFEAWTRLSAEPSFGATLLVAGAGAELPAWRRRVQQAGLGERIRFLGFQEDVRMALWAADALASPTRYEAFGLAVQEALCCGLPALVSASAGVAERYPDALRPLLVDQPENAASVVTSLLRWAEDPDRARDDALVLSAALRAWTWDDMARAVAETVEAAS